MSDQLIPAIDRRATNFIKEIGIPGVAFLLMWYMCLKTLDKFDAVTLAVNNNTIVMGKMLSKLDIMKP